VRSRRAADKHAPRALLNKARFEEVPKQYFTHLTVEACHPRGVSGGELYSACFHEQMLDTCERLFETPRLEWLLHVRCSSQLLAIWPPVNETNRRAGRVVGYAEIAFVFAAPRRAKALMKANA
jgi:hypothetical protein